MFQTRIALAAALAAGLAAPAPALAGPQHLQIIQDQCGIQLSGSPAFCGCLSQTARDTLNENQQAFTAARVSNDAAEIARVQSLLSADEAMGVMNFMTTFGGCTP